MNRQLQKINNTPFFTYLFLSIQTAVFILAYFFPQAQLEFRGSMIGLLVALNQEYWRFVTPIFIHYGLMHFAVNSVVLYFMGQQVEAIYGHTRFFFIYLLSGIAGNIMSFAFNQVGIQAAGSSTALFGLFGAFVILGIHFKENHAIQAMVRQFALFVGLSLIFGLLDQSIDLFGHIGGFLAGVLLGNIVALPKKISSYSVHVRIISCMLFVFFLVFCLLLGFRKYGLF